MQSVEVELTDIAHGGVCVGHLDGRAVFARFGLPGERVRVAVTKERSKLLRGDVVEVLEGENEHRIEHPWPVAGPLGVGGADLGHVEFSWQSAWKTHVLQATLRRVGGAQLDAHLHEQGIEARVRPCPGDEATGGWARRTRVEFVVGHDRCLGMYREASHELVKVSQAPLAVEGSEELDLFSGAWAHVWNPGDRVRTVVASGSDPRLVIGRQCFSYPGIEAEPFVREDVVCGGELYAYRVHAGGFWQVHEKAGETLIRLVLEAAGVRAGEAVVELYSGAGLLTQPLAVATGSSGSVRAFEGARLAVEDGRANLREFPWAKVRTSRVDAKLVQWEPGNVVVADPPRSGLGIEVARALATSVARRIVLVSCDPAAMSRDVAAMVAAGRRVESIESVDLFPNTHHFETVTALS